MRRMPIAEAFRRPAAIFLFLFCAFATPLAAKPASQGHLANGLTYFIDPEGDEDGKVTFSLIVRVGNFQTLPREQSVAHVLEHIVHAGAHVADRKGSLRARLEATGGRWGTDTNAGTSETFTRYFIKLPAARRETLDVGLDVLFDWMAPRALSDEEIDRETKAVIEEFRRGTSATVVDRRNVQNHAWFPGHTYYDYDRDRIGELSATPAGVRQLHAQWYRPPNMAVVIRGDVDPDAVLAAIRARFADLPHGEPAPPVANAGILPVVGGHYVPLGADGPSERKLEFTYKYRLAPAGSPARAMDKAIGLIVDRAARLVLSGLGERYGAPANNVGISAETFPYPGLAMLSLTAIMKRDATREALSELLRVVATLRSEGLADADIDNAREEVVASLAGSGRGEAKDYVGIFINGAPDPSPEDIRLAASRVTNVEVNAWLAQRLDPLNRDVFVYFSKSETPSVPDEADFKALSLSAEQAPPLRLVRPDIRSPMFLPFVPATVRLVSPVSEGQGFVRWRLPRSGATLLYRRVQTDQFSIVMLRPGGKSRVRPEHRSVASLIAPLVTRSGLAGLDVFELRRFNASRGISLTPFVSDRREGVQASAPRDQLPLLLDLIRAQLLQPSCRADAFDDLKREMLDRSNGEADWFAREDFDTMVARGLGDQFVLDRDRLADANAADICRDYLSMTGDTVHMVVAIEGDLDPAELYRAVAAAIDLAPGDAAKKSPMEPPVTMTQAGREVLRIGKSELANVALVMTLGRVKDGPAAKLVASIMNRRISTRLRTIEKGTYSASADAWVDPASGAVRFSLDFDAAPENVDRLIEAAKDELATLHRDGVTAEELAAARSLVSKPQTISLEDAAQAWLLRATLETDRPVTDAAVRKWVWDNIDLSRLREFVRLPSE